MPAPRPDHRPAGTRPRRRHPGRVYWFRRLLALTTLAAVVVGFVGLGRLLTDLSDGRSDEDHARATSADAPPSPGSDASAGSAPGQASTPPEQDREPGSRDGTGRNRKRQGKQADRTPEPPPARPDGPCVEEDVVVTPSVAKAVGGSPITIRLDLTTLESEACRWRVSPRTLTMRITSGKDEIWTSRQCPGALPRQPVVVRKEGTRRVRVDWSARRSDEDCSGLTEWALPGYYEVEAAALAGEPRTARFELTTPKAPVVTRTVEPEPGQSSQQKKKREQSGQPDG